MVVAVTIWTIQITENSLLNKNYVITQVASGQATSVDARDSFSAFLFC